MKYIIGLGLLTIALLTFVSCRVSMQNELNQRKKEAFFHFLEGHRELVSSREDDASFDLLYDQVPFRFPDVSRESYYYVSDRYKAERSRTMEDTLGRKISYYFFQVDSAIKRAVEAGLEVSPEEVQEHFLEPSRISYYDRKSSKDIKIHKYFFNYWRYPNCMKSESLSEAEFLIDAQLVCKTFRVKYTESGIMQRTGIVY